MKAKQLKWKPTEHGAIASFSKVEYTIFYFSEEYILDFKVFDISDTISHYDSIDQAKQAAQDHLQELWESITEKE